MPRLIDAALFDFGGVFTDSPFGAAQNFGEEQGVDPAHFLEIVFGPYHEDTDHPWHCLERGEITLVEAREKIMALGAQQGVEADPFRIFASMASGGGGAREAMVERVRRLRAAGIRTALVTNNAHEFREAWRRMIPVDELFEVVVDSSEVGFRKPNPEIFLHTLSLLGNIEPSRAIFLDDYEGNIEAATRLGLRSVLVEPDPRSALEFLDSLLQEYSPEG